MTAEQWEDVWNMTDERKEKQKQFEAKRRDMYWESRHARVEGGSAKAVA